MTIDSTKLSGVNISPIGSPGGNALKVASKYKLTPRKKSCIRIGTWNVRSMTQAGKIQNAIKEMERMNTNIMGISEMRWPGTGYCDINDFRVYFSGTSNGYQQNGVGIIVEKDIARCVTNFVAVSERVMLLQISSSPIPVNIVQVYAPTSDSSDEEIEQFYMQILQILKKLPKQNLTLISGDFNAKVGKGRTGEHIGPHGLGERNERGERLSVFAAEHKLTILNTFFKLPPRRLYTWTSPAHTPDAIIRNQIDYILVNHRYRNSFTAVKTYPGADIHSDHNPVVGVLKVRMKKVMKKNKNIIYDRQKLKDAIVKAQIEKEMAGRFIVAEGDSTNAEEGINRLNTRVVKIKKELLKPDKVARKKPWMTLEILQLMEKRRSFKHIDNAQYKKTQRIIKQKIRQAKENSLQEKCAEIEILQGKYDSFNVHRKVKEITGGYKAKPANRLTDNEGNILFDKNEIKNTWKTYIEKLFHDKRNEPPQMETETGPSILISEVRTVIAQMKDGKAPGPDKLHAEFLKLLDDDGIKWLTEIFNLVYDTGDIPQQWLVSEFITIPKKTAAKKCSEYRTISLMSHLLKVFLKIIHRRIYKTMEEALAPTQFGFRDAVGTREALFSVQVLFQRCRDVNCDVYACFVDYAKAFDRVQHHRMIEILKNVGIDDKDRRIITNLYWNQTASVRVDGDHTETVKILRGVRQGCVLSPLLFNIYSEYIFREAIDNAQEGILLNGQRLNNIRYADDTVVFADSMEDLKQLMDRITASSMNYGLDINRDKTKFMVISKKCVPNRLCQLTLNIGPIERTNKYIYLGTIINDQWDPSQEVKCRIEKSRNVFIKMASVLKSRDLTLNTKMRLVRCYVFSVLLYGVEAWTLTEASTKKLEAYEMWVYRRMLRVAWKDHVTNLEVLMRMSKEKEILNTIKVRKLEYLGHIMRNENRYQLLQCILQGKVEGKRSAGRRRISWLKNLRSWFSTSTTGLFRAAVNKIKIANMIANIRNG